MAWRPSDSDGFDDDEDSYADDEGEYIPDNGDDITVPCPYCGREIVEDIATCPYCENYLSREDSPNPQPRPQWVLWTAVLCLLMALMWALGR
jgi:predicted nucleic acid-binding Zn ribbon protein